MTRRLLIIGLMFIAHVAKAQVGQYRNDLAVGFSGGYVLNRVSFNPTINQFWMGGMTLGATVRYTCEKYFAVVCALQGEINFSQLGWKENIETSTDTYQRRINYFQIPILARIAYGRERKGFQGYFLIGPQLGFYVSDSDERGGEWSEETLSLRPNNVIEQYYLPVEKKFEYGITGGLGLEYSHPKLGHFQIEGRYFYGLSDIFGNSKADTFGRSANGAIIIKVGWLYDVIKTKGISIK